MSLRHATFVLLIALGPATTAQKPDAGPVATVSGRDALARFNSTQEFLGSPRDVKAVQRQLSELCDGMPILNCIDYLKHNQQTIRAALPNNPEYWRAFHDLISGAALEAVLTPGGYLDPRKDTSKLIRAAYHWIYLPIAEDRIHDVTDQFVLYYQSARRHMSESSTLIDRLIFTAIVGIAHWQIDILMALHAAEGDFASIQTLAAALRPFSDQERSLRQAFHGESQYIQMTIENVQEIKAEDFPNSLYVPTGTLSELRKWAQQTSQAEWELTTNYIGEVTERGWSDYWGQGFSHMENDFSDPDNTFILRLSAIQSYAATARSSEVLIYPLLALSDVYLGLSSPGLPARAPPPYWNWSWDVESQKICLVPTHVAPLSSDISVEHPACVTYLSDVIE